MNPRRTFRQAVASICIALIVSWSVAAMPGSSSMTSAGSYTLQPTIVGAGGTPMQGGNWTLDGTIGPSDSIVQTAGGGLRLDGGFWHAAGVVGASDRIFRNGFD